VYFLTLLGDLCVTLMITFIFKCISRSGISWSLFDSLVQLSYYFIGILLDMNIVIIVSYTIYIGKQCFLPVLHGNCFRLTFEAQEELNAWKAAFEVGISYALGDNEVCV